METEKRDLESSLTGAGHYLILLTFAIYASAFFFEIGFLSKIGIDFRQVLSPEALSKIALVDLLSPFALVALFFIKDFFSSNSDQSTPSFYGICSLVSTGAIAVYYFFYGASSGLIFAVYIPISTGFQFFILTSRHHRIRLKTRHYIENFLVLLFLSLSVGYTAPPSSTSECELLPKLNLEGTTFSIIRDYGSDLLLTNLNNENFYKLRDDKLIRLFENKNKWNGYGHSNIKEYFCNEKG